MHYRICLARFVVILSVITPIWCVLNIQSSRRVCVIFANYSVKLEANQPDQISR